MKFVDIAIHPCKTYQMNWNNLHILVVLSREGSLAGAARVLGVNHATVSRRLSALEDEIGTPLVRRLARSTPLTEKGREISVLAIEMEERAQKIARIAKLSNTGVKGTVRMTAPPALISETLMPRLVGLGDAHPELRLEFVADTQIISLEHGGADIAVRLVEPQTQHHIVRKLGQISYGIYGTKDHIAQPKDQWRIIGMEEQFAEAPLQKWLIKFGGGHPFDVVSNDLHVQRSAAESGLGLVMLPDDIAAQSTNLVRLQGHLPPSQPAWLVIHPDVKNSPAIRVVADAALSLFGKTAQKFKP